MEDVTCDGDASVGGERGRVSVLFRTHIGERLTELSFIR